MKALMILLVVATVITTNAQTIRIADNNLNAPAGANIYTGASALQNAINAAAPDDIVYIQPSTTSYGNVTVGKRIILKGVGFNIPEIAPRSSTMGTLTIVNSSNGVDNVSGLVLTGFSFTTIQFAMGTGTTPYSNITADNITGSFFNHTACLNSSVTDLTIKNSWISVINIGHCNSTAGILVRNNIIDGYVDIRNSPMAVVTNNFFAKTGSFAINTEGLSNGIRVEHNIFSGTGATFNILANALVVNNIFFGVTPTATTATFYSNVFSNNLVLNAFTFPPIASGGPVNSGVNNISGTSPLFTNASVSSTYNIGYDYTLQTGSVCIGAASTGDNIGPSGGLYPWTGNLSLSATAVPVITLFGNSGVVPQNEPLKSNIKAKSN